MAPLGMCHDVTADIFTPDKLLPLQGGPRLSGHVAVYTAPGATSRPSTGTPAGRQQQR